MKLKLKWCLSVVIIVLVNFTVKAQGTSVKKDLPQNWHLLDKQEDGFYGISLSKAYEFVQSKNLKSKQVIVAVIDAGVDTLHEDLKNILWTNPKEIPGNGIDDDHNGYVDDVHGWNFLGNKDGTNVTDDCGEDARVYYHYKTKFETPGFNPSSLKGDEKEKYQMWAEAKKRVMGDGNDNAIDVVFLKRVLLSGISSDSILQKEMGKLIYTGNELDTFQTTKYEAKRAKAALLYLFKIDKEMDVTNKSFLDEFSEVVTSEEKKQEVKQTAPKDMHKEIIKDNEDDINDRYYGNNDIMASDPMHGTHVSGIIAAERNNGKGMDGIADNVRIMMIRAVPNGDEHDKDIALGIRYAVDNGAKVVNMSFGKHLSPNKKWIDDAVKYAESKGVLLVEAAGNDKENIDSITDYPNPTYKGTTTKASNWITVGASSDPLAEPGYDSYVASFSNYGKNSVDVFAPGVRIYSSLPGAGENQYGKVSGTSMAAPVVTGVAAFIMEYYPNLTAQQVKYCIDKSAVMPSVKVKKPGTDDELVNLSDISISGGIINAYEAVKLASALSKDVKNKDVLPKSKLDNKKD
jgi:cell wall-associated protease